MKTQSNFFWRFLGNRLSGRTKRMLLITSLYGCLHKSKPVDDDTLTRLNQALNLSNIEGNIHALEVPLLMRRVIWNGVDIDEAELSQVIGKEDLLEAQVCKLCNKVPDWLRYDGQEKDITEFLVKLPEFAC